MKTSVSKEKFAIEYLRKNEKVCETIFACLYGQVSNLLSKKNNGQKFRETVPLN